MRLILRDILEAEDAIGKLMQTSGLPPRSAYNISRSARALRVEIEEFQNQRRRIGMEADVIDENGQITVLDENGQPLVSDERWQNYVKALDDLLSMEVDVDVRPVRLSDLEKSARQPDIAPGVMMAAWFLFEDDVDEEGG